MNYWSLLLTFVGIQSCVCYKILCLLPYTGKSHYMVFEPLLDELLARGHQLTVVSFYPAATPHPDRRDVSLTHLAPLNIAVVNISNHDNSYFGLAKYIVHVPVVTQLAQLSLQQCETLLSADVFKEFINAEGDYDVILVEHFNSDCMLGIVHNYGLPMVGLSSCALLPFHYRRVGGPENPAYVPGMMDRFTEEMTFLERVENFFTHYFCIIWFEIMIRWPEQRLVEEKIGKTLPPLEDIAKNTSVLLVNTYHTLNGPRVLPPSVVEVGGIHLHNRTVQPLPPVIEQLVSEAKDGFIVFSFGSLVKSHTLPAKRLEAILKVFSRIPQHVFWKWETEDLKNVPKNVHLFKWLPQYDLLNHPGCVGFISHSGLLSLTEALAAGAPALAVPLLGDQFGNAAHAQRAGFARTLQLSELDEASFEAALTEVLSEKMRSQAKLVSEMWKAREVSPMDRAVFYVEKTARFGNLGMSSHARWLSRFQLAMLDIVGFLLLIPLVLVLSVRCIRRT